MECWRIDGGDEACSSGGLDLLQAAIDAASGQWNGAVSCRVAYSILVPTPWSNKSESGRDGEGEQEWHRTPWTEEE